MPVILLVEHDLDQRGLTPWVVERIVRVAPHETVAKIRLTGDGSWTRAYASAARWLQRRGSSASTAVPALGIVSAAFGAPSSPPPSAIGLALHVLVLGASPDFVPSHWVRPAPLPDAESPALRYAVDAALARALAPLHGRGSIALGAKTAQFVFSPPLGNERRLQAQLLSRVSVGAPARLEPHVRVVASVSSVRLLGVPVRSRHAVLPLHSRRNSPAMRRPMRRRRALPASVSAGDSTQAFSHSGDWTAAALRLLTPSRDGGRAPAVWLVQFGGQPGCLGVLRNGGGALWLDVLDPTVAVPLPFASTLQPRAAAWGVGKVEGGTAADLLRPLDVPHLLTVGTPLLALSTTAWNFYCRRLAKLREEFPRFQTLFLAEFHRLSQLASALLRFDVLTTLQSLTL